MGWNPLSYCGVAELTGEPCSTKPLPRMFDEYTEAIEGPLFLTRFG